MDKSGHLLRALMLWALLLPLLPATAAETTGAAAPAAAQAAATTGDLPRIDARPFPRDFVVDGIAFQIHQPQLESWEGNRLRGHAVMSVKSGTHSGPDGRSQDSRDYGTLEFTARTRVDKQARAVVLTDMRVEQASFPTASDRQAEYLDLARKLLHGTRTLTVSLDQLESALAIAAAGDRSTQSLPVRNDPPDIIFSTRPAVLVLVDGQPALKPVDQSGVQRVLNTRSLLLKHDGRFHLSIAGHWASATELAGPWTPEAAPAAAVVAAAKQAVDTGRVDAMAEPPQALKEVFAAGQWPEVFVRTHPAELIAVQGDPQFAGIPGTQLSYIANTGADVFVDGAADHRWYVLVSGRWFSATGSRGPWTYVPASDLPADFAKIPADSPKSGILASIPGTPESKEALISNSIPQMATVDRDEARLDVRYDGAPDFVPIAGTALQYARNAPMPVIRVDATHFYAVDKGVWFTAGAATGPWAVATSVPAAIYGIPSNSPVHYATYVRIYGQDGDEVYMGYTPGYYGTVVAGDVVVYGTGYPCTPWVGTYWYGCPPTYGMGVYFGWNSWVGWTFGWGWGWYDGWYGPYSPWWGPWYGPAYPWGWWGGGAAAWNVYGHWGNAAVRGTAAAWANPWTGNVGRAARGGYYNQATGGRGAGRAGINTNAYTGTTAAGAQGIRYNPETGRVVAGGGAAAVNPYTGRAAGVGKRTVVDPETGRVTRAAGGFHYNADTGTLHHGGVVDVNDNIYAGHDGHVYHYDDGQWDKITRSGASQDLSGQTRDTLDRDRLARERGRERINGRPSGQAGMPSRQHGTTRPVGGFRPTLHRGGMRFGGFRRR